MKTHVLKSATAIIFLFTICTLNVHAQITQIEYTKPDSNLVFVKGENTGVIFSNKVNFKIRLQEKEVKRYIPSYKTIEKTDTLLMDCLRGINGYLIRGFPEYIKQYYGYINSAGDTMINIHCIPIAYCCIGMWQSEPAGSTLLDGGASQYWDIDYNLSKNAFFNFLTGNEE